MGDNRAVIEQFIQTMGSGDFEAQERLLTDDFFEEYPQSGERIRGKDNRRAIIENYPGGMPSEASSSESAPQVPTITGSGDHYTAAGKIRYPNGEDWHIVSLIDLRDGKICRMTTYFAQVFEAPAWRAPYVERAERTTAAR